MQALLEALCTAVTSRVVKACSHQAYILIGGDFGRQATCTQNRKYIVCYLVVSIMERNTVGGEGMLGRE